MATIYASTNDGWVGCGLGTNWNLIRQSDTSSGGVGSVNSGETRSRIAPALSFQTSRGPGGFGIRRGFFEFDTSGIAIAPLSASFKIKGYSSDTADVIVVRSTHSNPLGTGDHDAFPSAGVTALGNSDGSGAGTFAGISGLTYSAEFTSWSTSGYNTIALNATALDDIAGLDLFKICIMEYDHDYLDITGSGIQSAGAYFADWEGTFNDPYLDYTMPTATVTHNANFFGSNF